MKKSILARRVFPFVMIIGLYLMGGCLSLEKSLSDPMLATADTDLIGVWKQVDVDHPSYLFIGQCSHEAGTPTGVLRLYTDEIEAAPGSKVSSVNYELFTTELKGVKYANLVGGLGSSSITSKTAYAAWNGSVYLYKYEVKGAVLEFWDGDETAYDKLKKNGTITDQSSLITYLKTGGDSVLFPESGKKTYHLVKG